MANYAQALGIHNKWAPILFAVVYFFLIIWYLIQMVRRHRGVYGPMAFFAATRVVAYGLRAAMARSHKAVVNKGIGIAYEVLYSVGFFSILLSTYNLLSDRDKLARAVKAERRADNLLHRSKLVPLLLVPAVILGTVGLVYALGTWGHNKLGNQLNSASTYIFLAVAVLIALLTFALIRLERSFHRGPNSGNVPTNIGHHHLILLLIATLLLLRTLYYAVTVHNRLSGATPSHGAQGNEHLWYPLAALAELLIAMLLLIPGLVPLQSLLARHRNGENVNGDYANEKAGATGAGTGVGTHGVGGNAHNNNNAATGNTAGFNHNTDPRYSASTAV